MRVLILAGEPSGDRYAAGIAAALRRACPGVDLVAMGGRQVEAAGARLAVDSTPLAVVGITEILSTLGPLLAARRNLLRVLDEERPDVVVPVDYPDFNLRIAAAARRRRIPVAWFVSPQVWAWRPSRVPGIGRAVSRMLVLFPFEVEIYQRHGVPVEHVGHPLVDLAAPLPPRAEARRALGLPAQGPVLALLPGSRRREVRTLWPILAAAAGLLRRSLPGLGLVVPLAPGCSRADLEAPGGRLPSGVVLHEGGLDLPLAAATAALVASGTATLETALAGCPLVACYRLSPITHALSRWLADPGFLERGQFSLPNLVLGRSVVPELYQDRCRPEALRDAAFPLLADEGAALALRRELLALPAALGGPGAFDRIARAAIEVASA